MIRWKMGKNYREREKEQAKKKKKAKERPKNIKKDNIGIIYKQRRTIFACILAKNGKNGEKNGKQKCCRSTCNAQKVEQAAEPPIMHKKSN